MGYATQTETRASIAVLRHEGAKAAYYPPACRVTAPSFGDFQRMNDLWIASGTLLPGTSLFWDGEQQDEAIYLLDGAVSLDGKVAHGGDAVFVDAGARCALDVLETAHVLHHGSATTAPPIDGPYGPAQVEGRTARVVTDAQATRKVSVGPDGTRYLARYFADGSAATNRTALFLVSIDRPSFTPPHSHSQDELIHVLDGDIRSGSIAVGPGETLAVAKDVRYSFRSEGEVTFLNFRRDASYITVRKGDRRLEAADIPHE